MVLVPLCHRPVMRYRYVGQQSVNEASKILCLASIICMRN